MQMDPTTLQLIQFLERTVSSGECVDDSYHRGPWPTSRIPARAIFTKRASRPRDLVPGMGNARFPRTRRRRSRSYGVTPESNVANATFRVRVAILASKNSYATCSTRLVARLGIHGSPVIFFFFPPDSVPSPFRGDEIASNFARGYARYRAPSCCC